MCCTAEHHDEVDTIDHLRGDCPRPRPYPQQENILRIVQTFTFRGREVMRMPCIAHGDIEVMYDLDSLEYPEEDEPSESESMAIPAGKLFGSFFHSVPYDVRWHGDWLVAFTDRLCET